MKKIVCILISIFFVLSVSNIPLFAQTIIESAVILPSQSNYANDRLIVELDNSTSLSCIESFEELFSSIDYKTITNLSAPVSAQIKNRIDNITEYALTNAPLDEYNGVALDKYTQTICFELTNSGNNSLISAIKKLEKMDCVKSVGLDYLLEAMEYPDDEEYVDNQQSYLNLIGLETAWEDYGTGSSSVKVGIIDSGIDSSHPDLEGNLDVSEFRDFTDNKTGESGTQVDYTGHGTFVAGVLGAVGDNEIGITGVCWDVTLISLKVTEAATAYASDVLEAIEYAIAQDYDILNLSYGWHMDDEDSASRYESFLEAKISHFNGLFVTAAGNDGSDNDESIIYPANYTLNNLITVGASNGNTRYTNSNYGENTVDIFAPGYHIYSTKSSTKGGGYGAKNGTSFAAPIVAGVAALMLSYNPQLRGGELKQIIISQDTNLNNLSNYCVSGGRVNAMSAVNHVGIGDHVRTVSELDTYCDYADCNTCGYSYSREHKKYVYEYYVEDSELPRYQARCRYNCGFVVDLCDSPEYGLPDRNTHLVSCPSGCCDFREEHVMIYTATSSYLNHQRRCSSCGYSDTEAHKWWDAGYEIRCLKCNKLQYREPEILSLPPVNETSSDETE